MNHIEIKLKDFISNMENERAADPKPRKRYKLFLDPEYQPHWVSTRTHSSWVADATVPPPETDVDATGIGSTKDSLIGTNVEYAIFFNTRLLIILYQVASGTYIGDFCWKRRKVFFCVIYTLLRYNSYNEP